MFYLYEPHDSVGKGGKGNGGDVGNSTMWLEVDYAF